VLKDPRELQGLKDHKEQLDHRVLLERKDRKDLLVLLV
jgi:hypothetical protein